MLLFAALVSLLMSAAIPRAFGDDALLFAGAYVVLQCGRNLNAATLLDRSHALHATFERIVFWSLCSAVLWIAGGLAGPGGTALALARCACR